MERFEKGDIVWFQGSYKCRVVKDRGTQIDYVPLEGFAPHQKGQTFTAEAIFFSKQKESLAEREAQLKEALEENKSLHALMLSAEKRGVDKAKAELCQLNLRIKQLEADCAVMREALEYVGSHEHECDLPGNPPCSVCQKVDCALATDSGKAPLAQLAVYQQALKEAKVALEYVGRHEHDGPNDESGSHYNDMCEFCKKVDATLTTINSVLGGEQ